MSTQRDTAKLQAWLNEWPTVREDIEQLITEYAHRDPGLHFELTLAQLELKDLDEAIQRIKALGKVLSSGDLLTSAELEATGNT